MTDLVTFGEAMLRYSPPADMRLESADVLEVGVAGAESNVGVAATRAGADVVWVSKLPATSLGRRVTNGLHGVGLRTDVVWADTGRTGVYYVEPGRQPRGTDITYDRTDAAITTATPAELPMDRIADATVFATSGITPGLSNTLAQTTAELLAHAQAAGTRTVFDLNYRAKLWGSNRAREVTESVLPDVDVFFVGERSADRLFDQAGEPEAILRAIGDRWDFDILVLTRGEWGAVALADGEIIEQRAFETETVDPIGTGDAFVGGFLARWIEGGDISDALAFGTATAALKRTIPGDMAIVTREEIERVVDAGGNRIRR